MHPISGVNQVDTSESVYPDVRIPKMKVYEAKQCDTSTWLPFCTGRCQPQTHRWNPGIFCLWFCFTTSSLHLLLWTWTFSSAIPASWFTPIPNYITGLILLAKINPWTIIQHFYHWIYHPSKIPNQHQQTMTLHHHDDFNPHHHDFTITQTMITSPINITILHQQKKKQTIFRIHH